MKKFKILLLFMVSAIMLVYSSIMVYADRSEVDSSIAMQPSGEISRVCEQANGVANKEVLVYSSDGVVSFSNSLYSELDTTQKREFMEVALGATRATGLGSQQKNKLYNFIAEQDSTTSAAIKYLKSDASADFVAAKSWFHPFSKYISPVLGLICLLVFMFMAMSMLFDCAYLVLPMFQGLLERGEPNKRPFGVSREAYITMRDINKDKYEGRNILSVYFSKRMPVLIICAICLGYLVTGKIYDIMSFIVDAFSGI